MKIPPEHSDMLEKWKVMASGLRSNKIIDARGISLREKERKKWRDILHRLLDITIFLAKQNLAFRGHREDETTLNRGNFLETVYLVSKYDSVLKEHLVKLEKRAGKLLVSYLLPKTQNEF